MSAVPPRRHHRCGLSVEEHHRAAGISFVWVGIVVALLAACTQAPPSPLAPSVAAGASATRLELEPEADAAPHYGAVMSSLRFSASVDTEIPCELGPFGLADHSNFVSTPTGNESLVSAAAGQEQATILTGFPCVMPSGTVTTDSRLVLTPSG